MQFKFWHIVTISLACATRSLGADENFVGLHHMCMENQTLAVQILATAGEKPSCQCQVAPVSDPNFRADYTFFPGFGYYKIHTLAKTWNEARKICNEENAHLAIINSKAEEKILLEMFKKQQSNIHGTGKKDQAFLGLHDLYQEGEWVTIFGESIYSTGYSEWSSTCYGAQPNNNAGRQHCASLILACGTMDDIGCSDVLAFFCEKPMPCMIEASLVGTSQLLDPRIN